MSSDFPLAAPQEEGGILGVTLKAQAAVGVSLQPRQAPAVWWDCGSCSPRPSAPHVFLSLALFLPSVYVTFPLTLEHICSVLKEETRTPQLHVGDTRIWDSVVVLLPSGDTRLSPS